MYADNITGSMKRAIDETERRRRQQLEYNKIHNIKPVTVIKPITNTLEITTKIDSDKELKGIDRTREIERLTGLMKAASAALDFELAIKLRDEISRLRGRVKQ